MQKINKFKLIYDSIINHKIKKDIQAIFIKIKRILIINIFILNPFTKIN